MLQAMGDNRAMEYMRGKRTLEVNPDHPVIASLKARFDESGEDDKNSAAMTELLYETSLLTSGFSVESPKEFANRYSDLSLSQLSCAVQICTCSRIQLP